MSSSGTKAQFTAALLLERHVRLSFRQLQTELKRIVPQAVLEGWDGPVTDSAADPGIEMLSLDGEKLSVLVVDTPAPAAVLQPGPFANLLWPNAEKEAGHHKAHIIVVGLGDPVDQAAALVKARAVTLTAAALTRLVSTIGVTWADAANLVRATAFAEMTKQIGSPSASVVPFWVRVMLSKGDIGRDGQPMIKAGTLGLHIFGLRELGYAAASLDPGFLIQHAYATADYLLSSGRRLADRETIGIEGQARFAISHADASDFVSFPTNRLCLQIDE